MDSFNTIVRFMQEGGIFMYPIMLVTAIGIAIAIERFIYLTISKNHNQKMWESLVPILESGDHHQIMQVATESDAPMGKVLAYGLSRSPLARRRDDMETAMEEGLMEIIPNLEKRTHYLATLANIATLLGLLGTIIGLIQAFTAVSSADPAEKANLLSSSISVAMNTTAFGLLGAIPLLLAHAFLQSKTTSVVDGIEMAAVKFLNAITGGGRVEGERP